MPSHNFITPATTNYTLFLSFVFMVLISCFKFRACGWHLAQTGLNESYRVHHLSLHYTRVFLCISTARQQFPTLIESNWPVSYMPLRSRVYPQRESHANGNRSDCELIQRAIWTQVDNLGRLWVLDIGWEQEKQPQDAQCAPKLLVYDLMRHNVEVLRIDCGAYLTARDANRLVVRLGPKPAPCKVEQFIYFIRLDDTHLLAYDIVQQRWQRRSLVSKKYKGIIETPFPIKAHDITFGNKHELLLSDADGTLYSISDAQLQQKQRHNDIKRRDQKRPEMDMNEIEISPGDGVIEMELLGSLLGPSKGMMIDNRHMGALFYAVPKFGAVVRCEYKRNLTAEDNEIIYFTAKNIQQIFFGQMGAVWLLTDRVLEPHDHCFSTL